MFQICRMATLVSQFFFQSAREDHNTYAILVNINNTQCAFIDKWLYSMDRLLKLLSKNALIEQFPRPVIRCEQGFPMFT